MFVRKLFKVLKKNLKDIKKEGKKLENGEDGIEKGETRKKWRKRKKIGKILTEISIWKKKVHREENWS